MVDDSDGLLENVVAEDMGYKFVYNGVDANRLVTGGQTKLLDEGLVIPEMDASEDLVKNNWSFLCLKALFNYIGRKFHLAESDEVASNEVNDVGVHHLVVKFNHILHKVVPKLVFNQELHLVDDHLGETKFLAK